MAEETTFGRRLEQGAGGELERAARVVQKRCREQ
jgi:hypothetical protein